MTKSHIKDLFFDFFYKLYGILTADRGNRETARSLLSLGGKDNVFKSGYSSGVLNERSAFRQGEAHK